MNHFLKKIAGILLIGCFLNIGFITTVSAQDSSTPPDAPSTPESSESSGQTPQTPPVTSPQTTSSQKELKATGSFKVTDYLTAKDQEQKYLKDKNPIGSFIVQMTNLLLLTVSPVAFLLLVIGGFMMLISNGNEDLVNKGKDVIKYALIGMVIVFSAYVIVAFVQSLFYEIPTAPTS